MKTFHEFLTEAFEEKDKGQIIINELKIDIKHRSGYKIAVDQDGGGRYKYIPYFKFFKGNDSAHAKSVARIQIPRGKLKTGDTLEYQIHPNGKGRHFNLKSGHFDILEEMLYSPSIDDKILSINPKAKVWDEIIYKANELIKQYDGEPIPLDTPIPDYRNILKDV